ncbi:hypothetical protein BT69DRAFT_676161 [Atractiella rhizophila]|nr:hypothetical protein BT69DRAFT_676161 [Atractiella rhizophila]
MYLELSTPTPCPKTSLLRTAGLETALVVIQVYGGVREHVMCAIMNGLVASVSPRSFIPCNQMLLTIPLVLETSLLISPSKSLTISVLSPSVRFGVQLMETKPLPPTSAPFPLSSILVSPIRPAD